MYNRPGTPPSVHPPCATLPAMYLPPCTHHPGYHLANTRHPPAWSMYPSTHPRQSGRSPGSVRQNGNIICTVPNWHCVTLSTLAGDRYPNYFPELLNNTVFNSIKCKRYFLYLKAKGLFTLGIDKTRKYAKTRNCTET